MSRFQLPKNSTSGFTLIEVLVSSLLTLIVMGMLFAVLFKTLDAWEAGTERLGASGDARLALDTLRTDLESLIARQTQYDQEWIYSTPVDVAGIPNTWLTFFCSSLDRDMGQQGDMVGVSYILEYQDPLTPGLSSDLEIFGLYKAMTTTEEAFVNALAYNDGSTQTALLGEESGVGDGYWDDAAAPSPTDPIGLLAPHVVKFSVAWWVSYNYSNGTRDVIRYDETHTIRLSNVLRIFDDSDMLVEVFDPVTSDVVRGTIQSAEISMTFLSEEAMDRYRFFLKAGRSSAAAAQTNRLIEDFGTIHTIRVPISY